MEWQNLKLPTKIIERICSYLGTSDIINMSKVFPQLFSDIDVSRNFRACFEEISDFLSKEPRYELVTTLNISCLYWIPGANLRRCFAKLKSLECLYAIDTNLSLLLLDYKLYWKLTKLKKLAISVSPKKFYERYTYFSPKITHFYLHLDSSSFWIITRIMNSICIINTVEELWLIQSGASAKRGITNIANFPQSIKKLTLLFHNFTYATTPNLKILFTSSVNGNQSSREVVSGELIPIHELDTHEDVNWNNVLALCEFNGPFSVKQAEALSLRKNTLENIKFDEINLMHRDSACEDSYATAVSKLLLYSNMKSLTKLSLSSCALFGNVQFAETGVARKRKRNYDTEESACLLAKISENSPNIQELELWCCNSADGPAPYEHTVGSITNFKQLKKLTLGSIPTDVNPKFLLDICSSCVHLTSLRISARGQHTSLHNMLCRALKKTTTLKNLRYEHPCNISIDKLFEALMVNRDLKLERLFVKCKSVHIFSAEPFETYLRANADLRFVYLVIREFPKVKIARAFRSLRDIRNDRQKIIVITQEEGLKYIGRMRIPNFQVYEMIRCLSHVSVLDVFNGFTK